MLKITLNPSTVLSPGKMFLPRLNSRIRQTLTSHLLSMVRLRLHPLPLTIHSQLNLSMEMFLLNGARFSNSATLVTSVAMETVVLTATVTSADQMLTVI